MCRPKAKVRTKGESTYLHRYVLLPLDAPRNFSDTYFIHMLFPLIFGLEPSYIYHSIQHIFFSMVVALSREVKNCAYTYFYLWRAAFFPSAQTYMVAILYSILGIEKRIPLVC